MPTFAPIQTPDATISVAAFAVRQGVNCIILNGNYNNRFHGKGWFSDTAQARADFWIYSSSTAPAGYRALRATTFRVYGTQNNDGLYTVDTPLSAAAVPAAAYDSATDTTVIRVAQNITEEVVTGGYVYGVSTYTLQLSDSEVVVHEGTTITEMPIKVFGADSSVYAEIIQQNFVDLCKNYCSNTAPLNPFRGMLWYSIDNGLKVWSGTSWDAIGGGGNAPTKYTHTQTVAQNIWTIAHNLNTPAPHICEASVFVDMGDGVFKQIFPQDISFIDANTIAVSFTNAYSGICVVRI